MTPTRLGHAGPRVIAVLRSAGQRLAHGAVRIAHMLRRVFWFAARPRTRGAHALALTADRELVLVTLSYARGWRLPGGGVKRGEQPRDAVLRELEEEIGMISHGAVRSVMEFEHRPDFKRDCATLFVVEDVSYRPAWSFEVKAVRAFSLAALPSDLARVTRRMIEAAELGR